MPDSSPHSSVSPKAMGLLGIIQEGFVGIGVGHTPSVDDSRAANRAIRELGAYILGLEEQLEAQEAIIRAARRFSDEWQGIGINDRTRTTLADLRYQLSRLDSNPASRFFGVADHRNEPNDMSAT